MFILKFQGITMGYYKYIEPETARLGLTLTGLDRLEKSRSQEEVVLMTVAPSPKNPSGITVFSADSARFLDVTLKTIKGLLQKILEGQYILAKPVTEPAPSSPEPGTLSPQPPKPEDLKPALNLFQERFQRLSSS